MAIFKILTFLLIELSKWSTFVVLEKKGKSIFRPFLADISESRTRRKKVGKTQLARIGKLQLDRNSYHLTCQTSGIYFARHYILGIKHDRHYFQGIHLYRNLKIVVYH